MLLNTTFFTPAETVLSSTLLFDTENVIRHLYPCHLSPTNAIHHPSKGAASYHGIHSTAYARMAAPTTTAAPPNTIEITSLFDQREFLAPVRDEHTGDAITSTYATIIKKRIERTRDKVKNQDPDISAPDLEDALLALDGSEVNDDHLTVDEKWEYICQFFHYQFLDGEETTNRALRAAFCAGARPEDLFALQPDEVDRAKLPHLPQICPSYGTEEELIVFFRNGNHCCPNLDCGHPIIPISLPYTHPSIKANLYNWKIGEFVLHDTGLFTMYENSKPIPLSELIGETQINPKETPSDIMVRGGRMGKPWLAPTVNGIRFDKSWTDV